MLYLIEVPTGESRVQHRADEAPVTEALSEILGLKHISRLLVPASQGRSGLGVSCLDWLQVAGVLHEWRNEVAETLALAVSRPAEGAAVCMDEFYGPAVFHAVTAHGPDWLSRTTVHELVQTQAQIASGAGVLDAPKPLN